VKEQSRRAAPAKAGQRERLLRAMAQAAARYGYGSVSVARVIEGAGVSRATFYEHFPDKEACFLAAFEQVSARIERGLVKAEADRAPATNAPELIGRLLADIARDPAAARIVLVEALAGGPAVRGAHTRLMSAAEAALESCLANAEDLPRLAISGRAVLEGAGGILTMRAFRGETARLPALRDDLLAWIRSYAVPEDQRRLSPREWRQLGAGLVAESHPKFAAEARGHRLPRGKSATAPEAVAGEHRERILGAVAELGRTKGYTAMTVADIVKAGSVTRETFYELFRSKEDAFLAAQAAGLEQSIALSATRFFTGERWPTRVWDGLEMLLSYIAAQPDLVYLDVIESYAAGAGAIRRSFDNRMAYTLFLEDGYRQGAEAEALPHLCSEAIGGAILGLLRRQVTEGRTERTLELLPEVAYVALAPFIGPVAALELVEAKLSKLS
jgi:AcrR family transcriptional regulator